jgi:GT2 family glycosyltransferase
VSLTASPHLDVIIVTARGSRDYLDACLRSLRCAPFTLGEQRIWVVDNNSGDDTELIVRRYPGVEWLPQDRNLGFGRANNVGLAQATGELVLFLNPDTEVNAGTLDGCAQRLLDDDRIGIVGCRQLDRAGVSDPNARRTFPSLKAAAGRLTGWDRVVGPTAYHTPAMAEDAEGPVDAVSGAFLLARRSLVVELEGFDQGYWMYGEDLDLCRRARDAGYLTWYAGSVSILHVGGASAGRVRNPRSTVAFHRSMARYYRKHEAGSNRAIDAAVYGSIWLRLALVLIANAVRRYARRSDRRGLDRP